MEVVRLATFNIHHGRGLDDRVDLERTATAIREARTDLIALQELDRFQPRSNKADQPAELERLTGLPLHFWPTVNRKNAEYGLAVCTHEVFEGRLTPLPRLGDEEPRGAVIGHWRGLSVVATHLSTSARSRRVQTEALLRMASELDPPVVVLGDFNQGRYGLRAFRRAGFDPGRRVEHTHTPRAFSPQIDFVLVGPGATLLGTKTLTTDASDHAPLVAEVVVSPEL
ncbi:MAG: endonuclease/exonuclease/phosphatase family protein [Actinomycetota bacterium]|nr:endonuclease/exonuclease/phosphatase family protein [Actinomycetota bacterium]